MKKVALLVLAVLLAAPIARAQETTITKFKDKPIHGLIVNGAFEVRLSQAETSSARVEIFEELQDKLIFEYTEEGFIRLDFKDDVTKYLTRSKKKPTAYIEVEQLRHCALTGACNLIAKGKFSTSGVFNMINTGTAYMTWINVECESASVDVTGSSKVDDITVNARDKVVINTAGTASAAVKVDCPTLTLTMAGTSKLTVSGKAENATYNVAGLSSLDLLGFDSPSLSGDVSRLGKVKK